MAGVSSFFILVLGDHKMEQPFCPFLFFFFCLGGWSTTLMAASKTALTFCTLTHVKAKQNSINKADITRKDELRGNNILVGSLNCTQCRQEPLLPSSALLPFNINESHESDYHRQIEITWNEMIVGQSTCYDAAGYHKTMVT